MGVETEERMQGGMLFRTMNGGPAWLEPLGERNQNQKVRSYLHKRLLDPQIQLWN